MKLKHFLLLCYLFALHSFRPNSNKPAIVINEILFNPRSNGYDFIEIYNNSDETFDANKMYIAKRNTNGVIGSITLLSKTSRLILPGEYLVLTEDADNLALNYLVKEPGAILIHTSLPSLPNDKGSVILLDQQKEIIDEVNYSADWHFKLIDNDEGISLERVDPDGSSQDASNWHSAASTAGYATPTYKNSQYKQVESISAIIKVTPKVFSPDNDGHEDIATIQYNMEAAGYIANISIFDLSGHVVRQLAHNGTLGTNGYWNWDGLDDKDMALPSGNYIIFTEVFNLQGKKKRFKNVVVLARKLP